MKNRLVALSMLVFSLACARTSADSLTANDGPLLESEEAKQVAASTEAGKYERKSISYINLLYPLDNSINDMPSSSRERVLNKIREAITMERFDTNQLSDAMTSEFIARANAAGNLSQDEIAKIMNETVVQKILTIVDLNKELRAQNYTTEAQRNSFYATKAKEFGYTDVEIEKVMNAAYICLPVVKNYWSRTSYINWPFVRKYKAKVELGGLWYRIYREKNGNAQAKFVATLMTSASGTAPGNRYLWFGDKEYNLDGSSVSAEEFALNRGLKNAKRNLVAATQDIPDFRLTGQVVENGTRSVGVDVGKKEGVKVDDKYRFIEIEELADGSIRELFNGWAAVSRVGDGGGSVTNPTRARVVAGSPGTGTVVSEYPRIPVDIVVKAVTFPKVTDSANSLVSGAGGGVQVDARYNIGRFFGWSQLFLALGYSYGATGKVGKGYLPADRYMNFRNEFTSVSYGGMNYYLLQRFNFRRFSLSVEGGIGSASVSTTNDSSSAKNATFGGVGGWYYGGNLGFALHPALTVEGGVVYQHSSTKGEINDPFYGKYGASHWENSGLRARVGLVYSPKSMFIDPVDFVRGLLNL